MNIDLYRYSLCIALTLMAFFAYRFFFGKVPDKRIFDNYLRSRHLMGAALLVLAANYAVHLCVDIRQIDVNAAIVMNLTTYFFSYGLFVAALHMLLDRSFISRKVVARHCLSWLLYAILSVSVLVFAKGGWLKTSMIYLLGVMLAVYGFILASHLLKAYHKAVKMMDNTHSDNISTYVSWMSVLTYWMLIFGISCSALTFLPDNLVFLWVLSSVPFYSYLYVSYQNYLLFYETIEQAIENDQESEAPIVETVSCNPEMQRLVQEWVEAEGYLKPGLTISALSKTLYTNRTYLSSFINQICKVTFREWICGLRLDYAKRELLEHPDVTIAEIAQKSGFLSLSNFNASFKDREGMTPAKWRISRLSVRQNNADLTK
ncbi:MAG TPA: AraC family transcriptional regulator [Rikenellaceae bacterium]|nr:AraC family transcriptional regulator [Rikenellaceae bacterium]